MSTCDTCREPGRCCKRLHLQWGDGWTPHAETPLDAIVIMARAWLPFVPLGKTKDGALIWSCPLLDADGRCGDYENRPQLCRDYQPQEDPLCVEFIGPRWPQNELTEFHA